MKPIKLTLDFFGPYRHEVVDFSRFEQQPLFLISGATGAGKSTLFDGLVYALYGDAASPQRQDKDLRSDFATPADLTQVTLTFSHRGKFYQVLRSPAQTQNKKRGSGVTEMLTQASLTVFQDAALQVEENQILQVKKVNLFLTDLLQMNSAQFRQIILLPQGDFRNFLDGDSDQKEQVLRNLFQTQRYERWIDALQQSYKDQRKQNEATTQRIQALLQQVLWPADGAPAETTSLPEQAALLASQLQDQQAKLAQLKQQKDAQIEVSAAAQTALQQGQQVSALLAQQEKLKQEQAKLAAQAPTVALWRQQLQDWQWARERLPQQQQFTAAQNQVVHWRQRLTANAKSSQENAQAQTVLAQEQAELTAAQPEQAQLQTQIQQWQSQLPLYQAVDAQQSARDQAAAQVAEQQVTVSAAMTKLERQRHELATLTAAQAQQPDFAGEQVMLLTRQNQLQDWQKQLAQLQQAQQQLQDWQGQQKRLSQEQFELNTVAARALATYQRQRSDFAQQQIARLSQDLLPGTPCPVCGSREHPAPAVAVASTVTEAAVDEADQARQMASRAALAKEHELAELTNKLTEQTTALTTGAQTLRQELLAAAWLALAPDLAADFYQVGARLLLAPAAKIDQAQQELAAAQRASLKAGQRLEKLRQQVDRAQAAVQADQEKLHQAQQALAVQQTQLADLKARLAADFATSQALQQALDQALKQADVYQKQVQTVNERQQMLLQQAKVQEANDQQFTEQLAVAQEQVDQLKTQLAAAFNQQWPSLTDFTAQDQAYQALLTASQQQEQVTAQLKAYDEQQLKLSTLLGEVVAKLPATPQRPDLAVLQANATNASARLTTLSDQLAAQTQQQRQQQKLLTGIQTALDQLTDLTELQELAEVTRGVGSQKLGLERYVLRMYLEEVLKVANTRLDQLTQGRYQLALDDELQAARKKSGLELNVYDDYTGEFRSVRTLSGGESFIAALSLALALGEVVQQQTGAIEINTLFIDEGFGSLDEEALQTAIAALTGLEGQQRLIGIISHVRELQLQITSQLQVVANGNGESHIRYRLADEPESDG
ncbi:AAA family ATPase [Lapidilactobacillus luobeiensis]|uniref:AAA family ATPase n=1 Tax=Lapidilactobacillus luobeiensis TaxID=2950371 RepID=UPI0021C2E24E|nr:SMC family ATPase [Lapidilactobacillus luobeiensis]